MERNGPPWPGAVGFGPSPGINRETGNMRTRGAIIGAGPAGLLLGHLLQHAELAYVCASQAASRMLAENCVGLPFAPLPA